MKQILYFSIIIFFLFLVYLAYCVSKEGYENFSERNKQVLSIPGISSICTLNSSNYGDPTICFDISYIDTASGNVRQAKAEIEPGYFINKSGVLQIVPYGNTVSSDKRSYFTKTKTAIYKEASDETTISDIDKKIISIQALIDSTKDIVKDAEKVKGYEQEIRYLRQKKVKLLDTNTTSNKMYNSDNLDITYHADPTKQTPSDSNTLSVGQMWIKDVDGKLKIISYKDNINTTRYYPSGSYVFNPPAYVPNYEESVFLSKMTNLPTISSVINPFTDDFCRDTATSTIDRETKCNELDHSSCKNSKCCVLFGGEKCVAGNHIGPTIKSNYSDITIINRDYYYYKNKCYGNCT